VLRLDARRESADVINIIDRPRKISNDTLIFRF